MLIKIDKSSRIVFMGTPDFACPSLQALIDNKYNVVAVFTQPDRPSGRGGKIAQSPVKQLALKHGIEVYQPLKIRQDGLASLVSLKPDICITAAFGQILSQEVLDVPKYTINVHASILPKHRGAAPIQWAIMQGDSATGVTTMLTDKGIDTGDMLMFKHCDIKSDDDCTSLSNKLSLLGAELLIQTLENFENLEPIKQDESLASYDKMISKEQGLIDFNSSAKSIVNKIRALKTWPKAYFYSDSGNMYKIISASALDKKSSIPAGYVVKADAKSGIIISTADYDLLVESIQAPNKNAVSSHSYMLGNSVKEKEMIGRAFK